MTAAIQVVITAEADGDLQDIYDRRLAQRGATGPDGADALLDRLLEAMAGLTQFPLREPIPAELQGLGMTDWRQVSAPPYRIIHAVDGDTVAVAVIADARRDFSALLERRLLQRPPRA
jgi:toxin ParE1/3/4